MFIVGMGVLTHLYNLGELHRPLSGALQVVNREDLHAGVVDQSVGLLHVGTLQTSNDGNLEVKRLDGVDETVGNSIASHDTAEDVDEDGSDLGVAGDQFEGLLNGGRGSTTADVEEVGGLAAVQLDDVHRRHGQTGTVDQAADVTVQLDEVQAGLRSADLVSVLLRGVAPRENLLLSVVGIVVETKLGVHAHHLVVGGLRQRVDLDLGGVLLEEDLVQLLDGVLGLLNALLAEAELGGDVQGDVVGDTSVDVDVGGVDRVGVLLGNTLDVHTTLRRGHNDGALGGTVHQDSQVELAAGELALANVDGVAETASSASLLGDELVTNHLFGEHLGLGRRVDDTDTALQTVIESSLSSATSQDLGLDDHVLPTDLLRNGLGLGCGLGDRALGQADAILVGERYLLARDVGGIWANILQARAYLAEKVGGQVLVDTQVPFLLGKAGGPDDRRHLQAAM